MEIEQHLELARMVYPKYRWFADDGEVVAPGVWSTIFKPSLTGSNHEKAQALDVIVAAEKIPKFKGYSYNSEGVAAQTGTDYLTLVGARHKDILTAASLAILESK